jgi:hypothetical protein
MRDRGAFEAQDELLRGASKPEAKTLRDAAIAKLCAKNLENFASALFLEVMLSKRYLLQSPFHNRHLKPWQAGLNKLKRSRQRSSKSFGTAAARWTYRWVSRSNLWRRKTDLADGRRSEKAPPRHVPLGMRWIGARERCLDAAPIGVRSVLTKTLRHAGGSDLRDEESS